ncbi:hypothetical protein [Dysosmobacter sp.]|uniref:hypothetical protein n=1 Tax=Dysosmobacter sp. TaxID=2591382 RepID=UPI002A85DF7E|nr:hypothetical protein [Dysosmobacter sp.]MDY3282583.1 hypothetical protein [Dysosmobacter sp.]
MNRPEKGFRTKRRMAEALKTLLRKKPLDRIRVHEITDLCELNRQTFYYHFPDVYALFSWALRQTVEETREHMDFSLPWREQLLLLLRLMEADRSFFLTALDPRFEPEFRPFFIEQLTKNQDCPLTPLQTAALASILLHWLQRENRETPENLLAIFEQLMRDSSWKPEMLDLLS